MPSLRSMAFAALSLTALFPCGASPVRVVADSVNLRAGAGVDYEVVGQVSRGDVLDALGAEGEWIQVRPPTGMCLWVYAQLVRDSVAAARVMVRSGPGINYRVTGVLQKGDPVTVVGASAGGDWLKIEAPTGCALWVNSRYVETVKQSPDSPPRSEPPPRESAESGGGHAQERPLQAPLSKDESRSGSVTAEDAVFRIPKELAGLNLAPGSEQGVRVEVDGILGPSGISWPRPAKWRLVKTDRRGHMVSAWYLAGQEERLASLRGRVLIVSGRKYTVVGAAHPVVVVEQIVPRD